MRIYVSELKKSLLKNIFQRLIKDNKYFSKYLVKYKKLNVPSIRS